MSDLPSFLRSLAAEMALRYGTCIHCGQKEHWPMACGPLTDGMHRSTNPEPAAMPVGRARSGYTGELRIAISTAAGPKPGGREGSTGLDRPAGPVSPAALLDPEKCSGCGGTGMIRVCCGNPVFDHGYICCGEFDRDGCLTCNGTGRVPQSDPESRWRDQQCREDAQRDEYVPDMHTENGVSRRSF
jgi:hypothetical protein